MSIDILIADDEPDIRMVARIVLEHAGYSVIEADDGSTALDIIDREDVALVFLDLRMPGTDGWQVMEELRARGTLEDLPVVVVSAHASPSTRDAANDAGAQGFLSKPFLPEDLVSEARRLLPQS